MNSEDWRKIKEIFNAALDLPENERGEFLGSYAGNLRSEVEKLLRADAAAEDFIVEPAFFEAGYASVVAAGDPYLGRQIDSYRLLEEIGQGGMGTVYLAARQDDFEKRAAVKLIKRGMDTNSVLKRFVMERQILARLEHPYIANLLDGGSTADGLPFFVMEYVEGLPVTKYCDAHDLSIRERLELFQKICAAVQYAHQNLVIHRDIKPSNILVAEDGTPKLLDFGIAKLLNPDWSLDTAEATATIFRVMTPAYASPEQLRGLPVATTSDVYSLGVVLYELLSGERPFKIESRLPEEAARIVLTEEPVKPSAIEHFRFQNSKSRSLNTTDQNRARRTTGDANQSNPKSKIQNLKSLKGDLDNIILKALRKEPARRYQSVLEFSGDIRRHLEGLPVTASADTISYRVGKFVRRHKSGVFASLLVLLLLVSATLVTAWQARRANLERARAEQRFAEVRKLTNSFMFEFHDSIQDLPGSTAARALVVKKALEYLEILAAENLSDDSLRFELAVAYSKVATIQGKNAGTNLGDTRGALINYGKAVEILEPLAAAAPNNLEHLKLLASAHLEMAAIYAQRAETDKFMVSHRRSIELYEKVIALAPGDKVTRATLSDAYKSAGDWIAARGNLEEAINQYRKASQLAQTVLDENPEDDYAVGRQMVADEAIAATLGNPNYTNLGDKQGALEIYRKMLALAAERLRKNETDAAKRGNFAYFAQNLGLVQASTGDWQGALENYLQALAVQKSLVRSDAENFNAQWRLANILTDTGDALAALGRLDEALIHHREAIGILEKSSARDKENVSLAGFLARAYQRNADALLKAKRTETALSFYRKALAINEALAEADQENMDIRYALAQDYEKIGKAMIMQAATSAQNRPELLSQARQSFEQSREAYLLMQSRGLKIKPISQAVANLDNEIAACNKLSAGTKN